MKLSLAWKAITNESQAVPFVHSVTKNANGRPKKVVVIDDLPDGLAMLAQSLTLERYEIFEAETGLSGLHLAVEQNVYVA